MKKKLEIIFEDDYLVVINKPAGLLSIPDRFLSNKSNLKAQLRDRYGEIFVVHRLDYQTSGIILFAKDAETHQSLSQQLQNRKIKKEYWALTHAPKQEVALIDAPIIENPQKKGAYMIHERGKPALTHYRLIQSWQRYALLSIDLITGRTHQIRVHLQHIGAPLLTDNRYSPVKEFYLSQIKKIRLRHDETERPLIQRSSLHARRLIFQHPFIDQQLELSAPVPKDMKAVIQQLSKKYGGYVEY